MNHDTEGTGGRNPGSGTAVSRPERTALALLLCLAATLLLCLAAAALSAAENSWNTAWTSHFLLRREDAAGARGRGADLEKIFRSLRRELWSLSSWMDTEKVEVFLYRDRRSYLEGKFKPSGWSGGMVRNSGRRGAEWSLAIYEPFSPRTVTHELTHLYFASFFRKAPGRVPLWLNEGLAEMMAEEADGPQRPSYRGPAVGRPLPSEEFLRLKKAPDSATGSVDDFYAQAHSVVRFLKRGNSPFKFEKFCRRLEEGEEMERALFSAYGFGSIVQFEKAWKKWTAPAKTGKK